MGYALGSAAILAASLWLGGWYWLVLAAPVVVVWNTFARQACSTLTVILPFAWVVLFSLTGDRRLFFPFTLYLAVVFGQIWRGGYPAGVSLIVALFALIRIEQEASFRVLAVELIVAAIAAMAGAYATRRFGSLMGAITASLLAFGGLVF